MASFQAQIQRINQVLTTVVSSLSVIEKERQQGIYKDIVSNPPTKSVEVVNYDSIIEQKVADAMQLVDKKMSSMRDIIMSDLRKEMQRDRMLIETSINMNVEQNLMKILNDKLMDFKTEIVMNSTDQHIEVEKYIANEDSDLLSHQTTTDDIELGGKRKAGRRKANPATALSFN